MLTKVDELNAENAALNEDLQQTGDELRNTQAACKEWEDKHATVSDSLQQTENNASLCCPSSWRRPSRPTRSSVSSSRTLSSRTLSSATSSPTRPRHCSPLSNCLTPPRRS